MIPLGQLQQESSPDAACVIPVPIAQCLRKLAVALSIERTWLLFENKPDLGQTRADVHRFCLLFARYSPLLQWWHCNISPDIFQFQIRRLFGTKNEIVKRLGGVTWMSEQEPIWWNRNISHCEWDNQIWKKNVLCLLLFYFLATALMLLSSISLRCCREKISSFSK